MHYVVIKYLTILIVILLLSIRDTKICAADLQDNYIPYYVTPTVNYKKSADFFKILIDINNNQNIFVNKKDLEDFSILDSYLEMAIEIINDEQYIALNKLEGSNYSFNDENLSLNLNTPVDKVITRDIKYQKNIQNKEFAKAISSFLFNYDLTFSHSDNIQYLSGMQNISYYINEKGNIDYSFSLRQDLSKIKIFSKHTKKTPNQLVRLDTNWTYDSIDKIASIRIGDSNTKAADWSGSARFAGIQYATNFNVRPDLIKYPLPQFKGRADLPSLLEIFVLNSNEKDSENIINSNNSISPVLKKKIDVGQFNIASIKKED